METNFSKWLGSMPLRQYKELRENIIRITGISGQAFWLWQQGKREPSEINNIRIAYYAMTNDKPKYMADDIFPSPKLVTDQDGIKYIHAKIRVNNSMHEMEERYVVYNQ